MPDTASNVLPTVLRYLALLAMVIAICAVMADAMAVSVALLKSELAPPQGSSQGDLAGFWYRRTMQWPSNSDPLSMISRSYSMSAATFAVEWSLTVPPEIRPLKLPLISTLKA